MLNLLCSILQAITTSKWDTLDPPQPPKFYDSSDSDKDDENNSQQFDEDKRLKLREIEVKTLAYQDELESGIREVKPGCNVTQMVEHYRKKLLRKVFLLK